MNCAGCGHGIELHGRRGYGSCRHGRGGALVAAVNMVEACVLAGIEGERRKVLIDAAMRVTPCECRRFRTRPMEGT
jgi:hypothetical protein